MSYTTFSKWSNKTNYPLFMYKSIIKRNMKCHKLYEHSNESAHYLQMVEEWIMNCYWSTDQFESSYSLPSHSSLWSAVISPSLCGKRMQWGFVPIQRHRDILFSLTTGCHTFEWMINDKIKRRFHHVSYTWILNFHYC
jgi:hypothetical protein